MIRAMRENVLPPSRYDGRGSYRPPSRFDCRSPEGIVGSSFCTTHNSPVKRNPSLPTSQHQGKKIKPYPNHQPPGLIPRGCCWPAAARRLWCCPAAAIFSSRRGIRHPVATDGLASTWRRRHREERARATETSTRGGGGRHRGGRRPCVEDAEVGEKGAGGRRPRRRIRESAIVRRLHARPHPQPRRQILLQATPPRLPAAHDIRLLPGWPPLRGWALVVGDVDQALSGA
jgi:hypothetical protein